MVGMEISSTLRFSWNEPSRLESEEATLFFCPGLLGERPRFSRAQGPLGQQVSFDQNPQEA